jgi:TetR/AcrR family transcriptional repressor of nem operon
VRQRTGQRATAQQALIDTYLSVESSTATTRPRAVPAAAAAALAHDMACEPGGREAHRVYIEGVSDFAE